MLALSLRPRENSLRQVLIEATPEGLVGTFGIEIDGQEPVRLAGGILKELVEALQVHVASHLLVYLFVVGSDL